MFSSKKKYLAFFLSLILVLTLLVGCGDDDELEETGYTFRPEEDYPIRDFSDVNFVYIETASGEEYDLEQEEPGKWTGDFTLDDGTEYFINYNKDYTNHSIPILSGNYLIAGEENEAGVKGSFDWAADYDNVVLLFEGLIGISDESNNPKGFYHNDAEITVNGAKRNIDDIADDFADRNIEDHWYNLEYHYQESFEVEATVYVEELKKEEYELVYENGEWLIKELDSYIMDYLKVSEENEVYNIELNIETAIDKNKDFSDYELSDFEKVVLMGNFNDWEEDENIDYDYSSEVDNDSKVTITINDEDDIYKLNSNSFKIAAVAEDGEFCYVPSGFGGQRILSRWERIAN